MCYGRHFVRLTSCVPSVPIRRATAALAADESREEKAECTNLRVCGVYPRHTQRYFRALTRASAGSLQVTRRLSIAVFWGEAAPMPRGSVDHEPSHCRHGVWLHASRMFGNDAQPESRFHEIGSAGRNADH